MAKKEKIEKQKLQAAFDYMTAWTNQIVYLVLFGVTVLAYLLISFASYNSNNNFLDSYYPYVMGMMVIAIGLVGFSIYKRSESENQLKKLFEIE